MRDKGQVPIAMDVRQLGHEAAPIKAGMRLITALVMMAAKGKLGRPRPCGSSGTRPGTDRHNSLASCATIQRSLTRAALYVGQCCE